MLDTLISYDTDLLLAINGVHAPFFDSFMSMYSGRFIWIPMYAALLYVMIRAFGWKRAIMVGLGVGLAICMADQGCATWLRPHFMRLRPSNLENPISAMVHIVNGHRGGSYGFPSCHAANTFALSVLMSCLYPRRLFVLFLFGWALLTCYSRSYLGVHYPGDLFVGAIVGSIAGYICYWLIRFVAFHGQKPSTAIEDRPGVLIRRHDGSVAFRLSPVGVFVAVGLATVLYIIIRSIF